MIERDTCKNCRFWADLDDPDGYGVCCKTSTADCLTFCKHTCTDHELKKEKKHEA